ncbi:sugar ABC transporter permease [Kribbella solani]|uniref:Multiple sugar transport system permease protein n=1 Tax=Kribbella solani TaxID=236067 RepID=A0A841E0A5_9ACTN|nr:sugar ABC transporter permease [Kribbella solani]MBB5980858.1 multiple sugar transport system permease protein [Kribbella solani]MDX2968559.1 sugar ABC transporter permease [Kribbella solani]MDX3003425.1 sugar ABC transporter permease [Kribbella solani]
MTLTEVKHTPAGPSPAAASVRPLRQRLTALSPFLYLLPALVALAGVLGYPVLDAVWTSLKHSVPTDPSADRFTGLANYRAIFGNGAFWTALGHTGLWALANLVLQLTIGFGLALLMHQKLAGRALFRSVVIIPWVVPSVVVAVIWRYLLDPTSGPLNQLLMSTGLTQEPVLWLANQATAMPVVILLSVWKWTPFVAVILLAGLQAIPEELHEAAMIDGAGLWGRLLHVVVPGIRTSLTLASLLTIGYSVNNFNGIWLFTQGGPIGATETLTTFAYRKAFTEFDFGSAAAVAVVLFAGLFVVSTAYFFSVEGRKGRKL